MRYDLAVQLVNYNTQKYLTRCLETVLADLKESGMKYVVSILDNNSADDLTPLHKKYELDNVFFYVSATNLGFGGGHNYLAKKSDARYLLLLNPDTLIIEPDSIRSLYERIRNDPKIKIIGPKLIKEDKRTPEVYDHGESSGIFAKIAIKSGNSRWRNRNEATECAWVSGAALLIEKAAFDSVGGFDENFFLYKEEEDLCLRIRQKGYRILYYPRVKLMHIGSVVASRSDHMERSLEYFIEKHFRSKPGFLLYRFLHTVRLKIMGPAS